MKQATEPRSCGRQEIVDILNGFFVDYTIAPHNGGAVVLFLFPYRPFEPFPEGHLFLDNYYIASQAAHKKIKEILAALKAEGYEAKEYRDEWLKDLAERLGAAKRCKNDLVYTEKYGSYFKIDAIRIATPYRTARILAGHASQTPEAVPPHAACNACIAACPNGALSQNGFDRAKCLRQFMDKRHNATEEEQALIGDRLMGCIECRAVCPKNAHIKSLPIPEEVLAATKKGSIDYDKIKQLIGDNLLKM